jgi:hypothetical protein
MEDFSDGLDSYGSDAGSLGETEPMNDNIFDEEFDPSVLLKEPLFDDVPVHHDRMFNKSSMAEDDFGTFVEVAAVPPAVPSTPTDSGTSSPYMSTPRNYLMDEQMGRLGNDMRGMAVAPPQGLPLLDHQNYAPVPRHHRRSSPPPAMGYGGTVPIASQYRNSPPSPPMMSSARMTGLDMNTSPSMMPPDVISVHSMPNSVQSDLRSVSSFEGPRSQTSPVAAGQEIKSFNEAMEKLCESMKRSAMSRNLVKQLSGRNIVKQGSSRALSLTKQSSMRSLPRQGSGRFQLAKELSNRSLHTQSSSRSLHKQSSGRNLTENSGRVTPTATLPVRRMSVDAKHRICTSPGRGMYRQMSSGSLNGKRAQSTMLQIDDSAMGIFYPEDTIHA